MDKKKIVLITAASLGFLMLGAGVGALIYFSQKNSNNPPTPPTDLCANVKCDTGKICDEATGECTSDCTATGFTCPLGKKCNVTTRLCESDCTAAGFVCPTGTTCNTTSKNCEIKCTGTQVYVPRTDECEEPAVCSDDDGYQLDPETNTCQWIGRKGVTGVTYVASDITACPFGYTPFASLLDLNKGAGGEYIYGCKRIERATTSPQGVIGYTLTQGDCPSGWIRDPFDLNKGTAGKSLYSCIQGGDPKDPNFIRDIDAADISAGSSCTKLGTGWQDNPWSYNWGATSGHTIDSCLRRGKIV